MAEILVDSDVLIDHLRGARPFNAGADAVHYSVVTRCELFAGPADQEAQVRKLLASFRELQVDRGVAELAGGIRRASGLRIADAMIAATAINHRLTLMSRNRRDFERVPGLALAD